MKVLITRPRSQAASFGAALQMAGFEPLYFPVIEIRPMEDLSALDQALAEIGQYTWVIFTSANAVTVVLDRIRANDGSPLPNDVKIAAIGPKTAEALRICGIEPSFIPDESVGDAILPGLGNLRGKRVLLPRAEIAHKALPKAIRAAGGVAHEIPIYHTLPTAPDPAGLVALKTGVDVVTFTSPSSVQNFVQIVRQHGVDPLTLPGNPKIACIGPITEKAAQEAGFAADVTADEYTTEGIIQAILDLQF
jgi:uroporphyrinogen III methyltransferase/synthase